MKKLREKVCSALLLSLFSLFIFPSSLFGIEIKAMAQIEPRQTAGAQSLEGILQIIHEPKAQIDLNSFQLEGKPLGVTFLRTEPYAEKANDKLKPGQALVSSFYRFTIPNQSMGLHLLSSISFKAEGQNVQTPSTSYEILPEVPKGPLILRAEVQGTLPLYPGQRTHLIYHILYKGSIELSREILPLIEAKGLKKIGGVEVNEYKSGEYDAQDISQQVQADQPGSFTFGPSTIEGLLYEYVPGKTTISASKVSARAPQIVVDVKPFPEKNKPPSFNGAVGNFVFHTKMLSPTKLNVGDVVKLQIEVSGRGEMDTVSLPDLFCQPGFSGFFTHGELPPGEKNEKGSKTFILELRPLSFMVQNIPSIEFSSFDPLIQDYRMFHSQPVPLEVTVLKTELQEKNKIQKQKERVEDDQDDMAMDWDQILTHSSTVDLAPDAIVKPVSFWKSWDSTAHVLWLVPSGIVFVLIQLGIRKYVLRFLLRPRKMKSMDFLDEAKQSRNDERRFFSLLQEAFLRRLQEIGTIHEDIDDPEELSNEGSTSVVRAFLIHLNALRYSKTKESFSIDAIWKEAKHLYRELGRG